MSTSSIDSSKQGNSGWLTIAAAATMTSLMLVGANGFGVFVPLIVKEFGWPVAQVSFAFSLYHLVGGPFGMINGWAVDRYPAWKVMMFGIVTTGVGYLWLWGVQEIWQLYMAMGILVGMGLAGAYMVPTIAISRLFEKNRGLAVGVTLSGHTLSYSLGSVVAAALLQVMDWRYVYVVFGAVALSIAAPLALALREPRRPAPGSNRTGAPGAARSGDARPAHVSEGLTLGTALRSNQFWTLSICWSLMAFAQMMFLVHFVSMAVSRGVPLLLAAGALSLYGIGGVIGRLTLGPLSDVIGPRRGLLLGGVVSVASLSLLLFSSAEPALYGSAALFGWASFGADTVFARCLPDFFGVRSLGKIMSGMSIIWRIGAAAGPTWAGYVFDSTGDYTLTLQAATVALAVAVVLFLTRRPSGRIVSTRVE